MNHVAESPATESRRAIELAEQPSASLSLIERGETLFSPTALTQALKVPGHRGGAHLNGSTVFRHIVKGVRGADGQVVRLEAVRVGARWLTSVEAFARFSARLTAAALPADASTSTAGQSAPVTPKQRSRAAEKATREADAIFGAA